MQSSLHRRLAGTGVLLGLALTITGCDELSKLSTIDISGSISVNGDAPAGYDIQVYGLARNESAFDSSYCSEVSADCFGRVDVDALDAPSGFTSLDINGSNFTLTEVDVDAAFIVVATGVDDAITCTTDILGFDETTKVVGMDSAVTFSLDGGLEEIALPRDIELNCALPLEEPTPPEEDPVEEPENPESTDEGGGIVLAGEPGWSAFTIDTEGTVIADASAEAATADIVCDSTFPAVLTLNGTTDSMGETAYIRIQFGSGLSSTYTTVEAPLSGGILEQDISLTGGYAVVQLDTDETLDGIGESHTITFCDPDTAPAQEMLTILTWDKDDTDVDTHVFSAGEEIAYYSMSREWGDLDIDDTNGFGPETFTSTPETAGREYEVQVHYYSDHGQGDTNVTLRAVYYDATTGTMCDITATQNMVSRDWWTVGMFGPGMVCD
jgi:hypothetical protein